ncbi:MAG: hypothetical protein QE271_07590 [Bacteriovoracaceae bacterium]|nr:hypothetical protein [Bacteriovoracaceae bacterium]
MNQIPIQITSHANSPAILKSFFQQNFFFLILKIIAMIIVLPGILLPLLFVILFPFNWIL